MHPIASALCFPFAAGLLTTPGASAAGDDGVEFFEKKIRPVLIVHCYKCHSAEAEQKGKLKGKLRLDLREAIRGRGESGDAEAGCVAAAAEEGAGGGSRLGDY